MVRGGALFLEVRSVRVANRIGVSTDLLCEE